MDGDELMNPSESSNLGSDSLEKEKILEDETEDLQDGLKLSVVTEEMSGGVLAENGCISLEDGSLKRSIETVETSVSGAKRARITVDEDQPSVHFTYNSLTRMLAKCWNPVRRHFFLLCMLDLKRHLLCGLEIIDAAARCFNCGSYNHSLRECPRPRDNTAVNNARNKHKSRRNQNSSSRNPTRYYQNSPAGKYDGLRPGALDDATRQLLGLGELDPPPWLNRMRELGYPPGYLDVDDEDQPSGITIYTDREIADQEDGEIMEADASKPKRKKTVKFPGINAPIPDNADERLWGTRAGPSSSDISRNLSLPQHRSNYSTDYGSRGYHREHRLGDLRDDGPPGDPGHSSSKFSFHPRFGGHDSALRSPSMARSQSDRSRSPMHDEESPMPFSFHSLHYSSSERHFSPLDPDSGRPGSRTSESMYYDRDRDLSSRVKDRPDDRHHRSWR
eukprot:XP_006593393.1 uncharacterized protein LOC100527170 isoform X2 [Glycine max]